MGWNVILSKSSVQDLKRIARFIAKDNPSAAERFTLGLINNAEKIALAPQMGVLLNDESGRRFLPAPPYLIIYRVHPEKREVHILRFWHGARGRRPKR